MGGVGGGVGGGTGAGGGKGTEDGSSPSWHPQSISTYSKHNPMIKIAGDGGDVEVEVARSKVESADLESDKTVVLRNNDNYNNFNLYSRHITSDNTRKDKNNTNNNKDNESESDYDMKNNARRVTSPLIRDKDTKQAAGPPYSLTGSFREEKALVSGIFDTTKIRKSGDFSIYPESSSIGRAGSKSDDKGGGGGVGGLGYANIDTLPIVEQKVR